jgi:hypothetical protein
VSVQYSSNRRKTARHSLNIKGKIVIRNGNDEIAESVEIENISYEGMGVVFSNNKFLLSFLDACGSKAPEAAVSFLYEGKDFLFEMRIYWVRLYQLGEHDFYAASGLLFNETKKEEEKIIEIILDKDLERVYLG